MTHNLTVKEIREAIKGLPGNTTVIIGNDDELNGVHNAWFIQTEAVSRISKRHVNRRTMLEGVIMNDPDDPGFKVYIGDEDDKLNRARVLVIT